VHVAAAASDAFKLVALLHDASEAYLVDIQLLKRGLADSAVVEARVEAVIAARFDLPYAWPEAVKRLDTAIVLDELAQNMAQPECPWAISGKGLGVRLKFWSPARAADKFMAAFHRYGGKA
jgi:uncharacterized protein